MLQRIEEWIDGQLHNLIELEIPEPQPAPLAPIGALATLLVVQGVLDITDAANAVHLTPQDLITEAQAWAAGSQP